MELNLLNRIAKSDLFRWYGYSFHRISHGVVWITDKQGRKFQVAERDFIVRVTQCGHAKDHSTAKWIAAVLNGLKRDDDGNHPQRTQMFQGLTK